MSKYNSLNSVPLAPIRSARDVGELIFEGVTKLNAVLGGGVALVASILIATFLPGSTAPLWIVSIVVLLLLWFCIACLVAVQAAVKNARDIHDVALQERARFEQERMDHVKDLEELEKERGVPAVEAAVKPFSPYQRARCIFIVRWPAMSALPMGAQVTISTAEATHERPLGGGFVRPPQQDGKSVVTLDYVHSDADSLVEALLDVRTHDEAVRKVRIGPGYDLQNLHPASGMSSSSGGTVVQPDAMASSGGTSS